MSDRIDLSALLASRTTTPLDVALDEIFAEIGVPRPGGPSGRGWSSRQVFQSCPHKYRRRYLDGVRSAPSAALEIGALFHQLVALHYLTHAGEAWPDKIPLDMLREKLLARGVSAEAVMEAYRLFESYAHRYEDDYLTPLAVEELCLDPRGSSCRFDLIAKVGANALFIPEGIWIVEHKTAGRLDATTLDGWRNDGEVLGQMTLWRAMNLDALYGPLQGVIVNIVSKARVVQFHRTLIPVPSDAKLAGHARDLAVFSSFEEVCRATGVWPRSRAACVTRYGFCDLYDECAEGED